MFHDSSKLDYFDLSRVGGTLTHLQKNLPILASNTTTNDDSTTMQSDSNNNNNKKALSISTENEVIPLEIELVDDLMLLYHLGMSHNFKQAIAYSQNLTQAIAQLEDTNKRIKRAMEQVTTVDL